MKINVIGATGMVGTQVVAEAVARGHEVAAYSRSGKAVEGAASSSGLDMADTVRTVEAVNDADVTIIAVSAGRGGQDPQPVIDAYRALIAAQPAARIIAVGGAGSLKADEAGTLIKDTPSFPADYYPEANAFATILQEFRNSRGVDWTVVAPSLEIAPGKRTGEYVTADDVPAGEAVSTQDFAVALIDETENPAHRQARFTVASDGLA
jgi:NAD-dependent epimerase/dehydratase